MPGPTLEAFADYGQVSGDTITAGYGDAGRFLGRLAVGQVSISLTSPSTWNARAWRRSRKAGASWARPLQPSWTAITITPTGNE